MWAVKMSYPQNYTLSTTTALTSSSAYLGQSGKSAVVALDSATQQDDYVVNGYIQPSTWPTAPTFTNTGHKSYGRFPRHGQKVASSFYAPPVMIYQPLGSNVLTSVNTQSSTKPATIWSKGHAVNNQSFYVQDVLSYFRNAVSKVTDSGLASSANAFLTEIENGNLQVYGSDSSVTPGDFLYDTNTYDTNAKNLNTTAASIGTTPNAVGSNVTRIFSFGDIGDSNNNPTILNGLGATDYVIIFCVGQVYINTVGTWNTSIGNTRKILVVATGVIQIGGTTTANHFLFGSTNNLPGGYSIVTGDVNGNVSASGSGGYALVTNGTGYQYTYDPNDTGSTFPGVVPFVSNNGVYVYGNMNWYDLLADNKDTFSTSVNGQYTTNAQTAFYNVTTSMSSTDFDDVASNILARLCCQYGVGTQANDGDLADGWTNYSGCYHLLTTFFGVDYDTALSFQISSGQVPNFGVSTEYHDFNAYWTPDGTTSTAWLQTYRVADQIYAPIKGAGTAGLFKYMTLTDLVNLFFGPSTADFVFPTSFPYYIETTEITADCTVSLSNFSGNTMASGTVGGMDPYTVTGSGTAAFSAVSTYRQLKAAGTAPGTAVLTKAVVPNYSYLNWAPFNGDVVAVDPSFGNAVNGIATIDRWPNRFGSVLSFQLICRPSAVATDTMSIDYNAGSVVPAPSTVELVTFKCLQYVRFSLITNANTGVFIVLAGASNSITIGSAQYTYTVSGSVGTLNKVSSGTLTQVGQWTFGVQPSDVIVWLTVTFGDTLMVTTVYEQANTSPAAGSASQPQNYFERVAPDTVDSYQSQINYSAGSQMYLPALSSDTATQLNQLGVYQVPGEPGIYVDYVFHPEAYFFNEVVIQGRRASTYSGNPAQTTVAISLADGTYQNLAGQTVTVGSGTYTDAFGNTQTVASGNILASSLPLSFGNITYVAVAVPSQTSPGSLVSELITIGSTQYPDFTTANKNLGLQFLNRGAIDGLKLTVDIDDNTGLKIDSYKLATAGTGGTVYYADGEGNEYKIVFPPTYVSG